MVIHLYSVCWNEERLLPYFFQYYDEFVDRFVFYDDGSTDMTRSLINDHPRAEFRPFETKWESHILSSRELYNQCWKESRGVADWVLLTPVDEFLYAPHLITYLLIAKKEGTTAIPALGYQMLADQLPPPGSNLVTQITNGAPWSNMSKLNIFNPDAIHDSGYLVGRHKALPTGDVIYPSEDRLLNLHYKYIDFEWLVQRHRDLGGKLKSLDRERQWGHKYSYSRQQLEHDWHQFEQMSIPNVLDLPDSKREVHHPPNTRWWRI